jgi:hypothetical protein
METGSTTATGTGVGLPVELGVPSWPKLSAPEAKAVPGSAADAVDAPDTAIAAVTTATVSNLMTLIGTIPSRCMKLVRLSDDW